MILQKDFTQAKRLILDPLNLKYTSLEKDEEGLEYGAGSVLLNNFSVTLRSSKITPKKLGQFVTLWKRDSNKETRPYDVSDATDFIIINVTKEHHFGQFVFSTKILVEQGILSSNISNGKRGFRIYPSWDKVTNPQAEKTQKWQLLYFLDLTKKVNIEEVKTIYKDILKN